MAIGHFGITGDPNATKGPNNVEVARLTDQKGSNIELVHYQEQKQFILPAYEEILLEHIGFEVDDIKKKS